MASIRKRGQRWFAEVRRAGAPPQRKSFGTKGEASRWARKVESQIDAGTFVAEAGKHTVRDLLERYRRYSKGKAGSTDRDRHINFWVSGLGDYRLSNVTRAMVIEIRDALTEDYATSTVNRMMSPLTHAFHLASTDWEWIDRTPLSGITLKEPQGRVRYLSDDERKRLLDTLNRSDDRFYCYVMIALSTGARRGEILALRWQDIDLDRGVAVIERSKNTDRRTIALIPPVVDALKRFSRCLGVAEVFADPELGIVRKQRLENRWRQLRKDAGLDDFRYHDLRHSFASDLAQAGASLAEIAAALGHRQLSMVRRYAHLSREHVTDVARDVAERLYS